MFNCLWDFIGHQKGNKHWKREREGKCTCKNRSTGLQSNTWQYIKNREKEDRAAISISLTQHSYEPVVSRQQNSVQKLMHSRHLR